MKIPKSISDKKDPDWRRLLRALRREQQGGRVPFYELFVEAPMVELVMEEPYSIAAEVGFYYNLCHDYVNFTPEAGLFQTECLVADDTGENNPGGKREWLDSNDGLLAQREGLESYNWQPSGPECCEKLPEYLRHLPDGMGVVIRPLGVFENVRRLMGLVPLSYALYDDPDFVAEVFERVGQAIYGSLEYTFRHADLSRAFACIMGDDLAAGKGTIVDPQVYKEHVYPWMKRCADLAHAHDMPFGLHCCGDTTLIMEDLLALGVDAKHSFQDNVIPVQQFKVQYGSRCAVLGGVDMDKLASLDAAAFEPYCRDVLESCAEGGGYALGTGNSPATYIRLENFFLMHQIGLETA